MPIHQYPTQSRYNQAANAIKHMANMVMDADRNMIEYRHLIKDPKYKQTWLNSCSNELGRLVQGRESS